LRIAARTVVRLSWPGKEYGQRHRPNVIHRVYHKSRLTQHLEVGRVFWPYGIRCHAAEVWSAASMAATG